MGLFRGDGCSTVGGMVLDLVNPVLVDQVQLMLRRLGVMSIVRRYTNQAGNLTGHVVVPDFPVSMKSSFSTSARICRTTSAERNAADNLPNRPRTAGVRYSRARSDRRDSDKVYNLHVKGTHTYSIRGQSFTIVSCFASKTIWNPLDGRLILALQLSKRGGGVALLLSNVREHGAPIKKIENQSSGVIPIMKLLEDSFSYANQLGARQVRVRCTCMPITPTSTVSWTPSGRTRTRRSASRRCRWVW